MPSGILKCEVPDVSENVKNFTVLVGQIGCFCEEFGTFPKPRCFRKYVAGNKISLAYEEQYGNELDETLKYDHLCAGVWNVRRVGERTGFQ